MAFEASRQLQWAELTQLRRQRCQRHLSDGALVVTSTEIHQVSPGRVQRCNAVKYPGQWPDLVGLRRVRRLGLVGRVPHHPQQFTLSQRHTHQAARGQQLLTPVTQRFGDLTVRGCVHQHRQAVFQAVLQLESFT